VKDETVAVRCYLEALYHDPDPHSIAWGWLNGQYDKDRNLLASGSPRTRATVEKLRDQYGAISTGLAVQETRERKAASVEELAAVPLQHGAHPGSSEELIEQLRPTYRIQSKGDLSKAMVEVGIGTEEAAIIADAFMEVGYEGYILIEDGKAGRGYSLRLIDCSDVIDRYSQDELLAEIERLREAVRRADEPDQKAKLWRQWAETFGGLIAIRVNYQSVKELQAKKSYLPVYIEAAREILLRSMG
jgi:hypothetical protein